MIEICVRTYDLKLEFQLSKLFLYGPAYVMWALRLFNKDGNCYVASPNLSEVPLNSEKYNFF